MPTPQTCWHHPVWEPSGGRCPICPGAEPHMQACLALSHSPHNKRQATEWHEATMHKLVLVGPRRYDLFAVRVRVAVFAESGMTYQLCELWEDAQGEGGGTASHTYRGPSLTLLGRRRPKGRTWPGLLVLTAPGILEVRAWGTMLPFQLACYFRSCIDISSAKLLACPSRRGTLHGR